MKILRKTGSTSQILQVFIRDSSSIIGAGLTGLAYNSGSLTAYYHKDTDTTATQITLASMTVGTFTSGGFAQIDATNMPGWYQFCPPNASLSSGSSVVYHLKGATNMAPLTIEIDLASQVDLTKWNGTAVSTNVSGIPVVDVGYSLGQAITSSDGTAQSGTSNTIVLDNATTPSTINNNYVGRSITIVEGTGIGQSRKIISYTNSSKTVTVYPVWLVTPDNTSKYVIGNTIDSTPTIQRNVAFSAFPFYMVSSSDHASPATGATVTAQRSIDGGSFASCSNSPTEVGNGHYKIDLSAADLNGSVIALKFTATSCDQRVMYILTVA